MLSNPQPRIGTLQRLLAEHSYFASWDTGRMRQLEGRCKLLELAAGATVIELDALDPHIHFLLDGAVGLRDADGQLREVHDDGPDSRFPIARLRPSNYEVTTLSSSLVLEVEQSVLRGLSPSMTRTRFTNQDKSVGGSWQSHPLAIEIHRAVEAGSLALPVIPSIAMKIRRALSQENYSTTQISQIISADPVISAKLVNIANSVLFRGVKECTSVQAAVVRLGMNKVQNVVLALSTATLFNTKEPKLRTRLAAVWRHLVEIGTLAGTLAKLNGKLDSDLAMLAGLLHEIGKIPILEMATRQEDLWQNPGLLDDIVNGLGPMVSVAVLRQWDLPLPAVEATEQQDNWTYDHDGVCSITDTLLVAHILSLVKARATGSLPRLDETPAFSKITSKRMTPGESLQVLAEVQDQTATLRQLLG